jgi:Mn2+/Fe2+ NRAMP family transporter
MKDKIIHLFKSIGPGFMVAAAGIGAGDMVVGIKSGESHGLGLLWAVIMAVVLKYYLTEGIARWQLSTGTTIINGWTTKFNKVVSIFFLILLVVWSFSVAGALISACGLAGHALFPMLSVNFWGVFHSIIAALLVYFGNYSRIENITKILIFMMFLVVIITAILINPDPVSIISSLKPDFSLSSFTLVFAILGGVGGSVTMISYGYWLQEKSWNNKAHLKQSKIELAASYVFTGLFVVALMVIASSIVSTGESGIQMVLAMSQKLEDLTGGLGKIAFLLGFWGVVFSSILCVWQGIPYIFADFMQNILGIESQENSNISKTSYYKFHLFMLAFPPLILLFYNDALTNIVNYALISTVFVVFLASTLLYLNNKREWVGDFKYGWVPNTVIIIALISFLLLLIFQLDFFN